MGDLSGGSGAVDHFLRGLGPQPQPPSAAAEPLLMRWTAAASQPPLPPTQATQPAIRAILLTCMSVLGRMTPGSIQRLIRAKLE